MARKPSQTRSKETVKAIIEGGFICINNNGLEGTTTKKIAAISGVSIGSIYDYFDNKDEIYKSMVQVFVDELIALLNELTPELETLKIGDVIRLFMSHYHRILEDNDGLYLNALTLMSRFENEVYVKQIERALMDIFIKYTVKHPEYLNVPDLITFIMVVINTGVFSTIRLLNNPHEQSDFETLTNVIVSMVEHHVDACLNKATQKK